MNLLLFLDKYQLPLVKIFAQGKYKYLHKYYFVLNFKLRVCYCILFVFS